MTSLVLAILAAAAQGATDTARVVEATATVSRDTVLIGQPFDLVLELNGLGQAENAVFPEFAGEGAVTPLAPPQPLGDRPEGQAAVRYRLVAWELGERALRADPIVLRDGSVGDGVLAVAWPEARIFVASALPEGADADSLTWRPPADVIGPNWSLQERILGGALLLALLVLVGELVRRRARRTHPVPVPEPVPPREKAMRALYDLERSNMIEAGELKAFYSGLSGALRGFLAESVPRWSRDLTTAELMRLIGDDGIDDKSVGTLGELLGRSDGVKFGRRRPAAQIAMRDIATAKLWVLKFQPPPEPEVYEAGDENEDAALLSELAVAFADVDESEHSELDAARGARFVDRDRDPEPSGSPETTSGDGEGGVTDR